MRERLRELVRQVSHKRPSHAVLAALFRALDQPLIGTAGFDDTHAANRARLAYSAYVGFVQLSKIGQARMSHEEFEAYIRDFIDTLVPR